METLELEQISYRGKLVKIITEEIIKDYLFESYHKLPELVKKLQEKLNENFKFTTRVHEFKGNDNFVFGQISFADETGRVRVVDITVTPSVEFKI
jgi:hypothetical protein